MIQPEAAKQQIHVASCRKETLCIHMWSKLVGRLVINIIGLTPPGQKTFDKII